MLSIVLCQYKIRLVLCNCVREGFAVFEDAAHLHIMEKLAVELRRCPWRRERARRKGWDLLTPAAPSGRDRRFLETRRD